MKADGIEYDERMELLEEVTYPKPLDELLDAAFELYRRGHPWVADIELSPKSVVRDMYERAMTFAEYVAFYQLARTEGLVLRYLSDAYRALRQTVPEDAQTEELLDLIEWLGELVRQVDSSLLDEWERLRNPADEPARARRLIDRPPAGHRQPPRVPRARAQRAVPPGAAGRAAPLRRARRRSTREDGWDADALGGGARRRTSTSTTRSAPARDARGPALLLIDDRRRAHGGGVRQILDDPAGDHDWGICAEVDLAASDEAGLRGAHYHGRRSILNRSQCAGGVGLIPRSP